MSTGESSARPPRPGELSVLARLEADGRLTVPDCILADADASAPAVVETKRSSERYQVLGEIARGGVGIVMKTRDADLGRDVAMKVVRDEHLGNDDVVARFVEEAQIGGQLQHPGIVPVYELGVRPDGRPYFTMKLVKGRTFAELFAERRDPGENRRRLLSSFESVCQTIAYAHARGVVHRDLKPLNVMVGAFGEVQVVDWGLAKVLGQDRDEKKRPAPAPNVSIIQTVRGGESSLHSSVGSVLGTPAYMPPEQARGDVAAVDQRSDVFALGAVLCEILTGAAPYTGDPAGLVEKAANADLADALARLDACRADADLVTLAKQCLAPAAAARPRDAGAVAERLAACFAAAEQRARDAQVAAAEATVRANTAARSRRLTAALAAAVLAAAVVAGGGYVWFSSARAARIAEADRAVDAELGNAAAVRGKARASHSGADWVEAASAAKGALAIADSRGASGAARSLASAAVAAIREESDAAAAAAGRDERDRTAIEQFAEIGLESWDVAEQVTDAGYAAAFKPYGIDPDKDGADAVAAAIRASPRVGELASALDAWANVRASVGKPADTLRAAARAADPDPWRTRLREAKDRGDLAQFAAGADVAALPVLTLIALGDALGDRGDVDGAVALFARVRTAHPGDFAANSRYAYWLGRVRPRRAEDTLLFSLAALALRPKSAALWNDLGVVYAARYDREHAEEAFDEALRLKPGLAAAHANRAKSLYNGLPGEPAARKAALDRVIAECNEAIGLDKKCVTAYSTLGYALYAVGQRAGGLDAFREAARVRPNSSEAHRLAGIGLETLPDRKADAEAEYRKAIELDAGNSSAHYLLATMLFERRDFADALASFREASRLEPDNLTYLTGVGNAPWWLRDNAATIDAYRRMVRAQPTVSGRYYSLGYLLLCAGDVDGAVRTLRVVPMLANGQASSHEMLGMALLMSPDGAQALARLSEAVNLDGGTPRFRANLALAQMRTGLFTSAGAELRRTRELVADAPGEVPTADRCAAMVDCCELLAGLSSSLPSYVPGGPVPSTARERAAVAFWLNLVRRYAASAELYASAFEQDPSVAGSLSLPASVRYDAATAAAAAGTGVGADGDTLDAASRARMRARALSWLREELAAAEPLLAKTGANDRTAVVATLENWFYETLFAGVRNRDLVAKLPADEQVAWNALWSDVETTIRRAKR